MTQPFFANVDLASISVWLFVLFFAGLVYYLQRENMREGYPLEDDDQKLSANQGMFPVPDDKTFHLPGGRGTRSLPSEQTGERDDLALQKTANGNGFPFEPTGDPMADGVGPASYALRRDEPERDAHGKPKIVPMSSVEAFHVSAGRDPRGLPVQAGDGGVVGTICDMWVDEPEQLVRYLQVELNDGAGKRLVPMPMARIKADRVRVRSIHAAQFPGVPETASASQVTLLEEDRISGYYGGGYLYASADRLEPQI